MPGHFFAPPPRPIGRGGIRRLQNAVLWLFLGGGTAALFLAIAIGAWKERSNALRIVHSGKQSLCTVISKRKTTGRSPRYYVTLKHDGPPSFPAFERKVDRSEWTDAAPGVKTVYYSDPLSSRGGIVEMERSVRESRVPILVGSFFCIVTTTVVTFMLWKLGRELNLLRNGVESVAPQRGIDVALVFGNRRVAIRRRSFLPVRWSILARLPSGETGRLVLGAPDGSSFFYPTLSDVPVESLVGHEAPSSWLGRPPRPPSEAWAAWSAWRRRPTRISMIAAGVLAAVGAALSFSLRPPNDFWIFFAVPLAAGALFILVWMKQYWRDRVLWKEGFEIQAVLLKQDIRRGARGYRVGYTYHGHEFQHVQWLPLGRAPRLLESPPDAPAVTTRALILIDPHRPDRWSLVPSDLGTGSGPRGG